jgi:O-antigen ligase
MQQARKSIRSGALLEPATPSAPKSRGERTPIALVIAACLLIPLCVAAGLAFSNETKVIGLVIAVLGGLVILAWPFYGLVFFVALLYTRPEESIAALAGMHFTLVISVVTLAGWLIGICMKRTSLVRAPIVGMMVAFGVLAVASAVTGDDPATALMDIGRLVILVVLVVNLIRSPDQYRRMISAIVVFTSYLAAYSIYLYQNGAALMVHGLERSRAAGIFGDPNDLATTIAAGLAFILFRLGSDRGISRLFYAVLAGVCIWAIALTDSRSGLLSLLVVGVGWTILSSRDKRWAILAAVGVAVAAILIAPTRMTNFDADEESANSRFWFWSEGIDQLIAHPVLGDGYGQFPSVNSGMTAHNSFVLCFAELGLFAYFYWIGGLYYCFKGPGLSNGLQVLGGRLRSRSPQSWRNPTEADATKSENLLNSSLAGDGGGSTLAGARLALGGYLTGSFWLSHTYSPILYLLMSLAVSAQIISFGEDAVCRLSGRERIRNIAIIALITCVSILVIWALAVHFRSR